MLLTQMPIFQSDKRSWWQLFYAAIVLSDNCFWLQLFYEAIVLISWKHNDSDLNTLAAKSHTFMQYNRFNNSSICCYVTNICNFKKSAMCSVRDVVNWNWVHCPLRLLCFWTLLYLHFSRSVKIIPISISLCSVNLWYALI